MTRVRVYRRKKKTNLTKSIQYGSQSHAEIRLIKTSYTSARSGRSRKIMCHDLLRGCYKRWQLEIHRHRNFYTVPWSDYIVGKLNNTIMNNKYKYTSVCIYITVLALVVYYLLG